MGWLTFAAWAREASALEIVSGHSPHASMCPDEPSLRRAIAERLGKDPAAHGGPSDVARVMFSRKTGGFEARVHVELGSEPAVVRVLSSASADCGVLSNTVATAIALLVDDVPESGPRKQDDASGRVAEQLSVKSERDERPTDDRNSARDGATVPAGRESATTAARARWFIGASTIASFGVAPAPALGAVGWAGYGRGPISVRFLGRVDHAASGSTGAGLSARTQLAFLGVAPCLQIRVIEACSVVAVASLRGEGGSNVLAARSDTAWLVLLGGRLAAILPVLPRLALVGVVDALAPVPRPALRAGVVEAWTMSPLGLSVGGGIQMLVQ